MSEGLEFMNNLLVSFSIISPRRSAPGVFYGSEFKQFITDFCHNKLTLENVKKASTLKNISTDLDEYEFEYDPVVSMIQIQRKFKYYPELGVLFML
jgi:hypothetical protein